MNHDGSTRRTNNNTKKRRLVDNNASSVVLSLFFCSVLLFRHQQLQQYCLGVAAFTAARVPVATSPSSAHHRAPVTNHPPPSFFLPHWDAWPGRPIRSSSRSSVTVVRSSSSVNLAEAYQFCVTHYELPTAALTAAVCAGLGDAAAQWRAQPALQPFRWDWHRGTSFLVKGSVAGVIWSQWYAWLDPVAHAWAATNSDASTTTWMVALLSTVLEQVLFAPLLFAVWDLPFPMLCRGDPLHTIPSQVQALLLPVCLENSKVWTVANLVIYSAPLPYRVVLTSCADAVWQMLLAEQLATSTTTATTNKEAAVEPPPVFLVTPLDGGGDDERRTTIIASTTTTTTTTTTSTVATTRAPVGQVYSPVVE